jgi:hypothetical protein
MTFKGDVYIVKYAQDFLHSTINAVGSKIRNLNNSLSSKKSLEGLSGRNLLTRLNDKLLSTFKYLSAEAKVDEIRKQINEQTRKVY